MHRVQVISTQSYHRMTFALALMPLLMVFVLCGWYNTHSKLTNERLYHAEVIEKFDEVVAERDELLVQQETRRRKIEAFANVIHKDLGRPMAKAVHFATLELDSSEYFGESFALGAAISIGESGYREWVTSPNGCCSGVKQLHHWWKKRFPDLAGKSLYDPEVNIVTSYRILREIRKGGKSTPEAILDEYYNHPEAKERQRYVTMMIKAKHRFLKRLREELQHVS